MENNNSKKDNSLFSLEQGLFGHKISEQQSHQPSPHDKNSPKKNKQPRIEARAFDLGEAIELRYNDKAFPTATPEAMSFFGSNSFASELEDESLPFEVEAFEVDKEVTPVQKPVTPQPETPVQPEIQQKVAPKPIEVEPVQPTEPVTSKPMEVQPVEATVVSPSERQKLARPVKQPTTVEPTPPQKELSDAEAFAADLEAILNGEKTYDSEQKQVIPTSSTTPPPAPATPHPHDIFDKGQAALPPQKPAEPVQMSRSHAIFDQMGKNMAHATDFDQGTVDLALEQRFAEFDRILDEEEKLSLHKSEQPSNAFSTKNFSVMNSSGTPRYVEQLGNSIMNQNKNNIENFNKFLIDAELPKLEKKELDGSNNIPFGQIYFDYIVNRISDVENRTKLVKYSEENSHIPHNEAVMWLELESRTDEKVQEDAKKYQGVLQDLWIQKVMELDKTSKNRKLALEKYLREHTALGKVICREETQFHTDDSASIQAHPAFWGLFIFSPCNKNDIGSYDVHADDKTEQNWIKTLINSKVPKFYKQEIIKIEVNGKEKAEVQVIEEARVDENKYEIYEHVPRTFAKSETLPGVYLHRSKAHGRDDFLVLVSGDKCMVTCTKGSGAYPPSVFSATAGQYHKSFIDKWNKPDDGEKKILPFSFSDADHGSWATLGFCIAKGAFEKGETEELKTDFENFKTMFVKVNEIYRLRTGLKTQSDEISDLVISVAKFLTKGFVQPFIAIELSSLSKEDLGYGLPKAIEGDLDKKEKPIISYPAQIVTCAPYETSLRLYKRHQKDGQNYDYNFPDLELSEWERCYKSILIPKKHLETVTEDATKIAKALNLTPEKKSDLERRMGLAYRMIVVIVASYVAFLKQGWGTDAYTSSFAARNFNTGPRDANQWGELARMPREVHSTKGKERSFAHVDLNELNITLKDIPVTLGLQAPWSQVLFGEDISILPQWSGSLVKQMTESLTRLFGSQVAIKELNKICDLHARNNQEIQSSLKNFLLRFLAQSFPALSLKLPEDSKIDENFNKMCVLFRKDCPSLLPDFLYEILKD